MNDRDALDRDDPGAPPGYLLDPDDDRTHEPVPDRDPDPEREVEE